MHRILVVVALVLAAGAAAWFLPSSTWTAPAPAPPPPPGPPAATSASPRGAPAPALAPGAAGSVGGIVRRRDAEEFLAGVPVRVTTLRGTAWAEVANATADAEGRFRLDGLAPGTYRVQAGEGDRRPDEGTTAEVRVEAGRAAEAAVELELFPAQGTVYARGAVTFDGGRKPRSFSFRLWSSDPRVPGRFVAEGEDGWFGKRLPREGRWNATDMVVEGEPHPYFFQEVLVLEGQPLSLVVEEEREVGVFVVDGATGQPLEGAVVVRRTDRETPLHPDTHAPPPAAACTAEPLRTDGTGRVSLGRGRGPEVIWVRAEGFAWTRASVPRAGGDDGRVSLVPGGTIRIRLPESARAGEARLGAWRIPEGRGEHEDLGPPMEIASAAGLEEVAASGFRPARYVVRAWRGTWPRHGGLLGSAVVEVRPDAEAVAALE